jgi:hypothetical protein
MTALVVPWRGDSKRLLGLSLGTALASMRWSRVLVIGGDGNLARRVFDSLQETALETVFSHYAGLSQSRSALESTNAAMRAAIEIEGQEFVWSADDIFWPRRFVSRADLVSWSSRHLGPAVSAPRFGQGSHGIALAETVQACEKVLGMPRDEVLNFEGHWPLLVDPATMLSAMGLAPKGQKRSTYGNLLTVRTGISPRFIPEDVKVFRDAALATADRGQFVSTGSAVSERAVARWLKS